jgi:hypothetical protein
MQDVGIYPDMLLFSEQLSPELPPFEHLLCSGPRRQEWSVNPLTGHCWSEMVKPWELMELTKSGKPKDHQPDFKVCDGQLTDRQQVHRALKKLNKVTGAVRSARGLPAQPPCCRQCYTEKQHQQGAHVHQYHSCAHSHLYSHALSPNLIPPHTLN